MRGKEGARAGEKNKSPRLTWSRAPSDLKLPAWFLGAPRGEEVEEEEEEVGRGLRGSQHPTWSQTRASFKHPGPGVLLDQDGTAAASVRPRLRRCCLHPGP